MHCASALCGRKELEVCYNMVNSQKGNLFFCLGCLCRLIAVGHAVRHSKKENYQKVKQAASLSRATPRYAVNCTT